MKKLLILIFFFFHIAIPLLAQEKAVDTLAPKTLTEVIVIGKKTQLSQKQAKPLTTVDDYLQQSGKVDMVKRGGYAWEPLLNSMATERTLVTIDGMRVFGACTDKMDPITSYVEVSNLSEATIESGQQGSCHGATIGGAIDLKRNRSGFSDSGWEATLNSGYETNSNQKILGTAINYTASKFYIDTDFMFRDAGNYDAGNHEEVLFSQFRKFNISGTSGFSFKENKLIEASVIYDKATDVGYPALPMDVSLAEALITSLKYEYAPKLPLLEKWETKIYYNTVTHKMDDTKRPFVPVHMDMPGWSDTYGFYSKVNGVYNAHHFTADLNSFYNRSIASMTMYPSDPSENLMFMYTWPDVRTLYNALFLEDNYVLNCHSSFKFTASIANHFNKVSNELGLESLQIFYPDMKDSKNRILKSFSAAYLVDKSYFSYSLGLAYGDRAPSVSEGYGFYLFNSFDRYDYIGNPELKNESSLEGNASIGFATEKFSAKLMSSYFHISNYIVGKPDDSLIPMTIGASGVKIYTALDYATIFNTDFSLEYQLMSNLKWTGKLVYSYGKDNHQDNLPFISPLRYASSVQYHINKFTSEIGVQGNAVQSQYNPFYGEDRTPSYAILNASAGYSFVLDKSKLGLKAGVENILDTYYSTFSDWNNIPRKGRNFFMNLSFGF
ncbi:TonB-dependent receptor plug domain-containing protein [Flavobacterium aquicola]|uniref:Iron complex outermembrane receptor protein n=1 Tax=Flavobacterium aquicola TaxID=1682742 RepID=A0A3E0EML5_9FLAO|nr:TonB-dependent receptor [Flavobacterium aquicola]REG98569.1 iron complex outermembrane receptor protein [Flavobacterium aquicola]